MFLVLQRYWVFIVYMALLLLGFTVYLTKTLNTDDIKVSDDYSSLNCSANINIPKSKNASTFEKKDLLNFDYDIQQIICSLDKNFDESINDRVTLFSYSSRILEFWTINRPDIAQYFYRKVITANENDALAQFIKEEKLK